MVEEHVVVGPQTNDVLGGVRSVVWRVRDALTVCEALESYRLNVLRNRISLSDNGAYNEVLVDDNPVPAVVKIAISPAPASWTQTSASSRGLACTA